MHEHRFVWRIVEGVFVGRMICGVGLFSQSAHAGSVFVWHASSIHPGLRELVALKTFSICSNQLSSKIGECFLFSPNDVQFGNSVNICLGAEFFCRKPTLRGGKYVQRISLLCSVIRLCFSLPVVEWSSLSPTCVYIRYHFIGCLHVFDASWTSGPFMCG